jgi:hypothetical protein
LGMPVLDRPEDERRRVVQHLHPQEVEGPAHPQGGLHFRIATQRLL